MALALATKTCGSCGETKPLSAYHLDSKGRHGVRSECKDCARARARRNAARRRAEMGDEAFLAKQRESTLKARRNPDYKQRELEAQRAYNAALHALRRLHSSDFDALLARERYERGLDVEAS